ncbi:hypothetical protein CHARACLAT_024285 [Characodon lateralis]|uniref:Uncharacterized protein n=1 Tax=Characodon lateralis TaxID=208331 RepID=A0ABU7EXU1_9TELE|nr:hypothetical protein [Characodon lateralis]
MLPIPTHCKDLIERIWRGVYKHALDFYQVFISLEDQGTLDPNSKVHPQLHKSSKILTLLKMVGTPVVLELKGISHRCTYGLDAEKGTMVDPAEVKDAVFKSFVTCLNTGSIFKLNVDF